MFVHFVYSVKAELDGQTAGRDALSKRVDSSTRRTDGRTGRLDETTRRLDDTVSSHASTEEIRS